MTIKNSLYFNICVITYAQRKKITFFNDVQNLKPFIEGGVLESSTTFELLYLARFLDIFEENVRKALEKGTIGAVEGKCSPRAGEQ